MTTSAMRRLVASVLGALLALAGALVAPAAWAADSPTVTVSQASRDGGNITITGKGFATKGAGVYVAVAPSSVKQFYGNSDKFVGYDPNKPMTESPSTIWVYTPEMKAAGSSFAQAAPMAADGSFTIKMYVPAFEEGKDYVVLTTKAHGAGVADKSNDTRTPVTYEAAPVPPASSAPAQPSTPAKPSTSAKPSTPAKPAVPSKRSTPVKSSTAAKPKTPAKPARTSKPVTKPAATTPAPHRTITKKVCTNGKAKVAGGSLTWGLRTSFTSYLRGPIANGSWKLSNGADWNGSAFTFPVSSGSFDPATKSGTLNYSGTIHMTGHKGILDVTFSNPSLVIKGSTGHVYLTVKSSSTDGKKTDYGRVDFATFSVSTSGNVKINGSSVKLTAIGAKAFAGFYKTGEPMDSLTSKLTLSSEKVCHDVTIDAVTGKVISDGSGTTGTSGPGLPATGALGPSSARGDLAAAGSLALIVVAATAVACRRRYCEL
ncbi:HtaA domain-containing protein [Cutibacterium sp.]|uniref:HtaA domain-containing protein n=1 Tax=Cutibacterium sp. TaxID=1912221 RepID=UPI0026DCBC8B|nr:HtaA domain-containing protein [Cutibacterium sp.]MDO4411662.1 HtaA domain-containing protein [Cutibacterium sp.]